MKETDLLDRASGSDTSAVTRDRGGRPHAPKKRVAVLAYAEYPFDTRIRNQCEILASEGYDVDVIGVDSRSGDSIRIMNGVELTEVPIRIVRGTKLRYVYQYALFFLLTAPLLFFRSMFRRYVVIHVHTLPDFGILAAFPCKLFGARTILDLHESMPELFSARFDHRRISLWRGVVVAAEKVSWLAADYLITANGGIANAIVQRRAPRDRITTVYNDARTAPMEDLARQMREELALGDDTLIVHAGGINAERDLGTLVRAVALLDKRDKTQLLIAGPGERKYEQSLLELASTLGIEGRVRFLGQLSPVQATTLMSLSSIGVVTLERNPHTELSWPSRIAEFAYLRKPLVVADLHFARLALGEAARFYEPGNPVSLARAIESALGDKDSARAVNSALRRCESLGVNEMKKRLAALYRFISSTPPVGRTALPDSMQTA